MEPTPASGWHRKHRYHHGELPASALQRGREIVASRGPAGLTLRGLARDLGVTATALVYHFGSISGLRAAVAESVLEQMEAACGMSSLSEVRRTPQEVGTDWVAFAASNPNLYRLASGEAWHRQSHRPNGFHGALGVPSPRRLLEGTFTRETRRHGKPKGEQERSRFLAFTIHGLALARMDGVPEDAVARGLERAMAVGA